MTPIKNTIDRQLTHRLIDSLMFSVISVEVFDCNIICICNTLAYLHYLNQQEKNCSGDHELPDCCINAYHFARKEKLLIHLCLFFS